MELIKKILAPTLDFESIHPDMGHKKKGKRKKKNMEAAATWTLRPTAELRQLVARGMKATGSKRQTLIFDLIRKHLPELVKRRGAEQRQFLESFEGDDRR